MKLIIALLLAAAFAFTANAAYTEYLIATCVTDTECQAADGQEI